jgi:predicted metal-dependent enzyme (double-stranded beta helix superfamily)
VSRPAGPLPRRVCLQLARLVADAPWLWADHVRHDPDGRTPVRLLGSDRYEAWVIGWTPGQSVELHDHGDALGALVVTTGELVEITGRLHPRRRVLAAGAARVMGPGHVHDVLNLGPEPATSVHVYSPPLTSMTFYDPGDGHPSRTEQVTPTPPVLGLDPAPFLHPAGAVGAW